MCGAAWHTAAGALVVVVVVSQNKLSVDMQTNMTD